LAVPERCPTDNQRREDGSVTKAVTISGANAGFLEIGHALDVVGM
jgi:hypothetical protein